jgi:hypothetical protein
MIRSVNDRGRTAPAQSTKVKIGAHRVPCKSLVAFISVQFAKGVTFYASPLYKHLSVPSSLSTNCKCAYILAAFCRMYSA